MRKFIVVTSINQPSKAVLDFARLEEWQVIVVGDKKTPANWHAENIIYLAPEQQTGNGWSTAEKLPWNHYSRKMMGYLYAMQAGADIIADVDDDNIPLANWGNVPRQDTYETIEEPGFLNIYRFFTESFIWPRGFPLNQVRSKSMPALLPKRANVAIWQFLANNDPDTDAIYRLLFDEGISFTDREPIVLDRDVFCPFNSQNTLITKDAFPLLYLPAFVSFRFTDILRGIIAQPILWAHGLRLGFGPATVIQERNPHDYFRDFEDEITTYLHTTKAGRIAAQCVDSSRTMGENLITVYEGLCREDIVPPAEIELLAAWLYDIDKIPMVPAQ